jgi:hypothetical protein
LTSFLTSELHLTKELRLPLYLIIFHIWVG